MSKDKIKSVYDTFIKEGYDMESESEFRKNIADPAKRKKVYDTLKKEGYDMEPFDEFERNIGYGKPVSFKAVNNMLNTTLAPLQSMGQNKREFEQTRRQTQATPAAAGGQVQTPLPATTPSALSGSVRGLQPEAPSRPAAAKPAANPAATKPAVPKSTPALGVAPSLPGVAPPSQSFLDSVQALPSVRKGNNIVDYYKHGGMAADGKPIQYGKDHQGRDLYLTPTGELTTDLAFANSRSEQYRKEKAIFDRINAEKERLKTLEAMRADKKKALTSKSDKDRSASSSAQEIATANRRPGANNALVQREVSVASDSQVQSLDVAIRSQKRMIQNLENALDHEHNTFWKGADFFRDFGRATWQKVASLDTWDFGISGLVEAAGTMKMAKRAEAGKLTDEDRIAFETILKEQEVAGTYDLGKGYTWGNITGESLGFMKDFILTGGFGGVAKGTATKAATKVAERVARKAGQNAATSAATKLAEKGMVSYLAEGGRGAMGQLVREYGVSGVTKIVATKALGVHATDLLVRAPLMASTIHAPKVATDAIHNKLGSITEDADGNPRFENTETWTRAIWQAWADNVIEDYSEMWGAHLPGLGSVGKATAATSAGQKVITSKLWQTLSASRLSQSLVRFGNSNMVKTAGRFLERAGVNGYFGEVGEEYYGQAWRTLLNLDTAYQPEYDDQGRPMFKRDKQGNIVTDKEGRPVQARRNNFRDGDFHLDIWGGMAMSVGLTGGGAMGLSYAGRRASHIMHKRQLSRATSRGRAAYSHDTDAWDDIQAEIDATTNEDMASKLGEITTRPGVTRRQADAILNYAGRLLTYRGGNIAEIIDVTENGPADPVSTRQDDAYEDGYSERHARSIEDARALRDEQRRRFEAATSAEEADALEADPYEYLSREGLDDDLRQLGLDYLDALRFAQGIEQRMRDDIDDEIAEAEAEVDARAGKDGTVVRVKVHNSAGEEVDAYVVGGNVGIDTDTGDYLLSATDKQLFIVDAEGDGKVRSISRDDIVSVSESTSAVEEKRRVRDEIMAERNQQLDDLLGGKISTNPGDSFIIFNDNAADADFAEVEVMGYDDEGKIMVRTHRGEIFAYTEEDLQAAADRARSLRASDKAQAWLMERRRRAAEAPQAPEDEQEEQAPEAAPSSSPAPADAEEETPEDPAPPQAPEEAPPLYKAGFESAIANAADKDDEWVQNQVDYWRRENADGALDYHVGLLDGYEAVLARRRGAGSTATADEDDWEIPQPEGSQEPIGENPEAAPEAPAEPMPMKADGNPDVGAVSAERARAYIYEESGLEPEEAEAYVEANIQAASQALSAAEGAEIDPALSEALANAETKVSDIEGARPVMGTDLAAYKQQKAEWQANLDAAREQADAARSAVAEQENRKQEGINAARAALKVWEDIRDAVQQEESQDDMQGVPEFMEETGADSRARGWRRDGAERVVRQVAPAMTQGRETNIRFSSADKVEGRYAVMDASELQPSHMQTQSNPAHFLPEAQPKKRTDNASALAEQRIAREMNPEEITGGANAYSGSPVVNARGEVIQGNNRSAALRYMYDYGLTESQQKYKDYLKAHAEEYGLTPEQIDAMQAPVLVRVADVSDEEAIRLGNMSMADTESGGVENINPVTLVEKLGNKLRQFVDILFDSNDEEASLSALISENGGRLIRFLNREGIISDTQAQTALSDGRITEAGRDSLRKVMEQLLLRGAPEAVIAAFRNLPVAAQKALLATAYRDYLSPASERMMAELHQSILAYTFLQSWPAFANARTYEEARGAAMEWARQSSFDLETGATVYNSEKFSNFAIVLAALYRNSSKKFLEKTFSDMYDHIQSAGEANIFDDADASAEAEHTLAAAIKAVLDLEYQPLNSNTNGQTGSDNVDRDNTPGEGGGSRGTRDTPGGERGTPGESSPDSGAGAASDSQQDEEIDYGHAPAPASRGEKAEEEKGEDDKADSPEDKPETPEDKPGPDKPERKKPHKKKGAKKKAEEKAVEDEKGTKDDKPAEDDKPESAPEEPAATAEEEIDLTSDLTEEEIEASDLDEFTKDTIRDYLKGVRSKLHVLVYNQAREYVRSKQHSDRRDSGDEDSAQPGSTPAGTEGSDDSRQGDGSRGGVDHTDDGPGVSSERESGEDGEGDMAPPSGSPGDPGVGPASSPAGGRTPRTGNSRGGRGNSGRGGNVRRGRGKTGGTRDAAPSGERGAQDADSPADNAGNGLTDSASSSSEKPGNPFIGEALGEIEDFFTDPILPRDQLNDVTTVVAALGVRAFKLIGSFCKLGYGLILNGIYSYNKWRQQIRSHTESILSNAGFSEADIDEFIEMVWDAPFKYNGVSLTMREWAAKLEAEELRRMAAMGLAEKRRAQAEAEGVETIDYDLDNIRESLPFLLPRQHEDVEKAERQFFSPEHGDRDHAYGKGYMFTNGTGTGKTYTGLGIAKRFLKRGKGRILIVTAQEKKINDWIADARNLGIEASMLPDTKSKGTGVVVTQYANLRQNEALLEDEFDLIIYDESHKLMENQQGEETATSSMHHLVAMRDAEAVIMRDMRSTPEMQRLRSLEARIDAIRTILAKESRQLTDEEKALIRDLGGAKQLNAALQATEQERTATAKRVEEMVAERLADEPTRKKAEERSKATKVVFLSATPFNTPLSLDYVEGYTFTYPEGKEGTPRRKRKEEFIMNRFPTSHIRSKSGSVVRRSPASITDPETAGKEEIDFSDYLQHTLNTMSGRNLDSAFDYSREFPRLDTPEATAVNAAISDLTKGEFAPLAEFFKDILSDYNKQTAFFEIMKTKLVLPRIREHLARGRKVLVFHRRVKASDTLEPPFAAGLRAAMQNPKTIALAQKFALKYIDLIRWEQTLDYRFPHEQIVDAMATQEDRDRFNKELKEWEKKAEKARQAGKKIPTPPRLQATGVVLFNGSETQKAREAAVAAFNQDGSQQNVLVAQVASAKEGISLHDTTGSHQRVMISLYLPQSPIEFIQTEGRIYRVGNQSNAIFEYPLLGINVELASFAGKINSRSQTTENLGLGSASRGLRDSIMRAALGSRSIPVTDEMGTGGKLLDSREEQEATDFDRAVRNWHERTDAGTSASDQLPDPLGFKLAEWLGLTPGENALVPFAAEGSVARYVPSSARLTAVEEDMGLFARLIALIGGGGRKIENKGWEDFSTVNKADGIAIAGRHGLITEGASISGPQNRDAVDLYKAMRHLEDSGRISMVTDSAGLEAIKEMLETNYRLRMQVTIDSAALATGPQTADSQQGERHLIVIDRIDEKDLRKQAGAAVITDLSNIKDGKELLEALRGVEAPARIIDECGRIKKRIDKALNAFKDKGMKVVKQIKFGGVSRADIYSSRALTQIYLKRNKMYWNTFRNGVKHHYDDIQLELDQIAEGNWAYISDLAKTYALHYQAQQVDDVTLCELFYLPNGKGDNIADVRNAIPAILKLIEAATGRTSMQLLNMAEGRVENEIKEGEMSAEEFENAFNSLNAGDAATEALGKKVLSVVRSIKGISFACVGASVFGHGSNVLAHYAPGKNRIELNAEKFNSVRLGDETKAQCMVHEMIHAVTCWAMHMAKENPAALTESQLAAVRDIEEVYEAIKDDGAVRAALRTGTRVEDNAEYGLTSAEEMIAELANPAFRAALKAKQLFRQLINGVKRLLGINVTGSASQTDAAAVLENALDTLLNEFDQDVYRDYTDLAAMGHARETFNMQAGEAEASDNGVEKPNKLLEAISILGNQGKKVANELYSRTFFDVAKTPDFMKKLGLRGERFTIRFGVISRHFGKDSDHNLPVGVWEKLPKALQTPFAITKHFERKGDTIIQKGYRIYTTLKHNDKYVIVGATVKSVDRNLEINAIETAFAINHRAEHQEVIYQSKEITPDQQSLLDGPNSHQYPADRELSERKGNTFYSNEQENGEKVRIAEENQASEETDAALTRPGTGEKTAEEVAQAADLWTKAWGPDARTPAQRRRFAREERRRMRARAESIAAKLNLDNVEILEDAGPLSGERARAKGFFNPRTGKITIILANHDSADDVEQTLLHEAVGHYGLRRLLGSAFDAFLDKVFESASAELRRRIVDAAMRNGWDMRTATEEYLSTLAETTDFDGDGINPPGWLQKLKSLFIAMLHEIGLHAFGSDVHLTDNELRYFLWASYRNLQGRRDKWPTALAERYEMERRLEVDDRGTQRTSAELLFRTPGAFSTRDRAIIRDEYERRVSTGSFRFREAMQDSMLGLRRFYEAVMGKDTEYIEDVADFENAYLYENAMSSMNLAQQTEYGRLFFHPLLKAIHAITGNDDSLREELTRYMIAKHGLERNHVLALRDATERAAEEAATGGTKTSPADWYGHYRSRDYSGLTSLTGQKDIADAEMHAQAMVTSYEAARSAREIDNLWNATNNATKATLERAHMAGLISTDSFTRIRDMFEYYIPLRGWDETTSPEVYGYLDEETRSGSSSPVIHAKGRKSLADDPIATIGLMGYGAIQQANRNVMKQRFLNFVLNHPSDLASVSRLWLMKNAASGNWEPVFPDLLETDTPEEVERKVADFEAHMESLAAAEPDKYKSGRDARNIPYVVPNEHVLRQHQVLVKRAGSTYVITINGNPRAAQALNGLTNPHNGDSRGPSIMKGVMWVNRQMAAFYTTRNPDFVASNFIRDALYSNAMTWVKESPRYALRFHLNFAKSLSWMLSRRLMAKWEAGKLDLSNRAERLFHEFMTGGGETGYTAEVNIEQQKKAIRRELAKIDNPMKRGWYALKGALDIINRSVENTARFAAYVTSREMGRSLGRSIYDAKEVSVNFNKKGAGSSMINAGDMDALGKFGALTSQLGRALYIFWNAGVQGTTNFGRAARRHPVKALALITTGMTLGLLAPMIAKALSSGDGDGDDDNPYYDLPEWTRRSNLCIRAGKKWISVPLPIEMRAFYGLGELASGQLAGATDYSSTEMTAKIAEQFSQMLPIDVMEGEGNLHGFIPSFVKPAAEPWIFNEDWKGLPIAKHTDYNKMDPEWKRVYPRAGKMMVEASKWANEASGGDDYKKGKVNVNPAQLEYFLSQTFGGYSQFANRILLLCEDMSGKKEFDVADVPVVNRVVKEGDARQADKRVNGEYYKALDRAKETEHLLKKYKEEAEKEKKNGGLEYTARLAELLNSREATEADIIMTYDKAMKKAQKDAEKEAESRPWATDAEEEERAEALTEQEKLWKREALGLIKQLRESEGIEGSVQTEGTLYETETQKAAATARKKARAERHTRRSDRHTRRSDRHSRDTERASSYTSRDSRRASSYDSRDSDIGMSSL